MLYVSKVSFFISTENGPKRVSESVLVDAVSLTDVESQLTAAFIEEHGASCDIRVESTSPSTLRSIVRKTVKVKEDYDFSINEGRNFIFF